MKILVVEDDRKVAGFIEQGLREEGYAVDVAPDGDQATMLAHVYEYDLIVLDVMLPKKTGLQVAAELRREGSKTPILMLTARDTTEDVVRGLDVGADDYLTKPFSFEVLAARLRVIARRNTLESASVLQVANLTLDTKTFEAHRDGRRIVLTRTEFVLLDYLMRRAGRVVSRDDLIESVWGIDRDVGTNTVDVFIFHLRSKLEAGGASRLIQTVRGFGYTMRESEEE